jgi:aconitate hydratase
MTRGTFANVRVKNKIAPRTAPSPRAAGPATSPRATRSSEAPVEYIYDAAMDYKQAGTPLVVLAGKDYGMGSSRDWAAKGTMLLGVKAVIAESFERIHRSNLVFMGVLPFVFKDGADAASWASTATNRSTSNCPSDVEPRQDITIKATSSSRRCSASTPPSNSSTAATAASCRR